MKPGALSLNYSPAAIVKKAVALTRNASIVMSRAPSQVLNMLRTSFMGNASPSEKYIEDDEISSKDSRLAVIQNVMQAMKHEQSNSGTPADASVVVSAPTLPEYSSPGGMKFAPKTFNASPPVKTLDSVFEGDSSKKDPSTRNIDYDDEWETSNKSPSAKGAIDFRYLSGAPVSMLTLTPTDELIMHFTVPKHISVTAEYESLFDYLRRKGYIRDDLLERYGNLTATTLLTSFFYIVGYFFWK